MSNNISVLALDGPSGSGKGTVGRRIAIALGWHFLESGALYRTLAYSAQKNELGLGDEAALMHLAATLNVTFDLSDQTGKTAKVMCDGEDISTAIREEACGMLASKIASMPAVRTALLDRQRAFREAPGLVADGRDMGTIVFPDAGLKIYLDASPEIRALRRHKQLQEQEVSVNLDQLLHDLKERDERDKHRKVAPLKPAEDAVVIDTSDMTADAVFDKIMNLVDAG